ncbi:alpha/beta hydrolase fold-domain-containing protein [Diplogelasinospora grovesii]|uniref:Delta(24)-sterol reductase n=1 Tax=Diplogelasinospora grovesii TaxID=303347 RepID=A0AAN6N9E1_9PEZI|nr:alpha/beta hydrolase fold-domain-containing protein [Diplogelasinospora grovesii]
MFKFFLSLLPKIPLITRVALLHILRVSQQSKYLDLRTELIIALLRSFLTPSRPVSISSTQRLLNRDPGVKGRIWVSTYACPVGPEDATAVQNAMRAAIDGLKHPRAPRLDHIRFPDVVPVEAEWTGYRAAASADSRPPLISEREKYVEMMRETTSPTTVLYFHGGAYYLMDPATHRPTTKKLAKLTGGRCYSVRYRLSPQHAFPSAVMDALVSYLGLLYPPPDAYHEPVQPQHIVFAGDSAGGNLSLALLQTLLELGRQNARISWHGVERELPLPAGVAVNSPWVDMTHSSPSCQANADFDYLPALQSSESSHQSEIPPCEAWPANPPRTSLYADDAYLAHPLVTVMLARSWAGSPPVYICTGWELLADEDKYTAAKFRADGVPVVFEEFEAMPHSFALIFTDLEGSRRCFAGWAGFIKQVVEGGAEKTVESRFTSVKAKTLEETQLEPEKLTPYTEEQARERVYASMKRGGQKMERHKAVVSKISSTIRSYFQRGEPYRIFHGSTNSTRPASQKQLSGRVDISQLCNVLSIDPVRRVALVEPKVPMDQLVSATLPKGLVPPVVMEFPGITAGGGFSGTAGESSSFKHGFFDDTVDRVEMVLADGQIVEATPTNELSDLFQGAAGAVGTLGTTTLLEVRLMEAKRFVRTRYIRTHSVAEAVRVVMEETNNPDNEYLDGILYSKNHGVVVTGQLTDDTPENGKVQTFSGAWDPWFYLHARTQTQQSQERVEYVPLGEYLFRYDRGGFWVGAAAFRYFKGLVPFNKLTRWWLDDFLHTRMMYRALHGSGESGRLIIQDVAMPPQSVEELVNYTGDELNIWPLWLCPLKRRGPPTFHPFTTTPRREKERQLLRGEQTQQTAENGREKEGEGGMMLNVGVWGWGPDCPKKFVQKNRELEQVVRDLGGMKWLYAHTYYTPEEFWGMYGNHEWYSKLREKYQATNLPTVYDKVYVDPKQVEEKVAGRHWLLKRWPLAGLVGIRKAIQSKDYLLHRNATWKYKETK